MSEIIVDAVIDSLKILAVVALCTFVIAFIEPLLSKKVKLTGKLAPLIGVSISLLPQCGFSVVATDLYQKRHLTLGTLIGVYLATSDEALPVFLSYPDKALHILPILALKLAIGILIGYLLDFFFKKSRQAVSHHVEHCLDEYQIKLMHANGAELVNCDLKKDECDCLECSNSVCPHHPNDVHHKHDENEGKGILYEISQKQASKRLKYDKINRFLTKPLLHSLEIFIYILVVNIIFAIIFYFVGEEKIMEFLLTNKYVAPLFSVIIGAIPNCVSSIVISKLYIVGGLGFGATLGGLCMNAGVAFIYLFKDTKHTKHNLSILLLMFFISTFLGYIFSFIFNFSTLNF